MDLYKTIVMNEHNRISAQDLMLDEMFLNSKGDKQLIINKLLNEVAIGNFIFIFSLYYNYNKYVNF